MIIKRHFERKRFWQDAKIRIKKFEEEFSQYVDSKSEGEEKWAELIGKAKKLATETWREYDRNDKELLAFGSRKKFLFWAKCDALASTITNHYIKNFVENDLETNNDEREKRTSIQHQ
jgi:hypothetical protein